MALVSLPAPESTWLAWAPPSEHKHSRDASLCTVFVASDTQAPGSPSPCELLMRTGHCGVLGGRTGRWAVFWKAQTLGSAEWLDFIFPKMEQGWDTWIMTHPYCSPRQPEGRGLVEQRTDDNYRGLDQSSFILFYFFIKPWSWAGPSFQRDCTQSHWDSDALSALSRF